MGEKYGERIASEKERRIKTVEVGRGGGGEDGEGRTKCSKQLR
jgi:hypothetical protein